MKYLRMFIVCFGFWLLLTFSLETGSLITGAAAALLTSAIFGRYSLGESGKLFQPQRYFWLIVYLLVFLWECLKANFDVAYRVIHPGLPIKPGIVSVETGLKSGLARTMLANSITMTPGTITVDIDENRLYIHWIYVHTEDPAEYTRIVSGRFEKFIKKIFE